jgi:hypothetical protein
MGSVDEVCDYISVETFPFYLDLGLPVIPGLHCGGSPRDRIGAMILMNPLETRNEYAKRHIRHDCKALIFRPSLCF